MNQRLEGLKQRVRRGEHRILRRPEPMSILEECEVEELSWMRRVARLTVRQCEAETPIIAPDEQIVFTRTLPADTPPIYSKEDWERHSEGQTLHELGPISNISADWGKVLAQGLLGRRAVAMASRQQYHDDPEAVEFLDSAIETIDAVLALAKRYAEAARAKSRDEIAEILEWVPANPPRSFHEALQSLRLLHAVVWLNGHYHVGLGRFDQYMWPYLKADLDSGRLDENHAADLLAEFFISLNKDSDLYPGVQ